MLGEKKTTEVRDRSETPPMVVSMLEYKLSTKLFLFIIIDNQRDILV